MKLINTVEMILCVALLLVNVAISDDVSDDYTYDENSIYEIAWISMVEQDNLNVGSNDTGSDIEILSIEPIAAPDGQGKKITGLYPNGDLVYVTILKTGDDEGTMTFSYKGNETDTITTEMILRETFSESDLTTDFMFPDRPDLNCSFKLERTPEAVFEDANGSIDEIFNLDYEEFSNLSLSGEISLEMTDPVVVRDLINISRSDSRKIEPVVVHGLNMELPDSLIFEDSSAELGVNETNVRKNKPKTWQKVACKVMEGLGYTVGGVGGTALGGPAGGIAGGAALGKSCEYLNDAILND